MSRLKYSILRFHAPNGGFFFVFFLFLLLLGKKFVTPDYSAPSYATDLLFNL